MGGELGEVCGQGVTVYSFFTIALLQLLTRIYMPFEEFIEQLKKFGIDIENIAEVEQKTWDNAIASSRVKGAWKEAVGKIKIDSDLPKTVKEIKNHKVLPYVNELVTSGKNFVEQINTWAGTFNDDISSYVSTIINASETSRGKLERTKSYDTLKNNRRKNFLENIKTSKGEKLSKFNKQTNDIEEVVLDACYLIGKKDLNEKDFENLDGILAKLAGKLDAYFKKHLYSTKVRNERKRLKALIRILQVKIKQKENSDYKPDDKERVALKMYEKYKKELETNLRNDGEKISFSGLNIEKWKEKAKKELKDVTETI